MNTEKTLIAIKEVAPKERPTSTSQITEIFQKSGLTENSFIQALQDLESQGIISLRHAGDQIKRINISTSLPQ